MLRKFSGFALVLALLCGVALAADPVHTLNVLDMSAPYNQAIRPLLIWTLVFSVLVLLVTGGALFYVVSKFRAEEGDNKKADQFHGNNAVETVLLVVPLAIVAVLSILTADALAKVNKTPKKDTIKVSIDGWQFWWDFKYTDLGVRNSNELIIPVGKPIEMEINGKDVIHSFWIANLGAKRDAIPGQKAHVTLTATKPGIYYGQCAELCGASHANMLFRVIALPPQEFESFVSKAKAFKPTVAATDNGRKLFEANCAACHAVQGTNAKGVAGPDLSYFGNRITLGAGLWKNEPQKLHDWIKNSGELKPGSKMPAFSQLSDNDVSEISKYLYSLKIDQDFSKYPTL